MPEQIIRKLREADQLLAEGTDMAGWSGIGTCAKRHITGVRTSTAA